MKGGGGGRHRGVEGEKEENKKRGWWEMEKEPWRRSQKERVNGGRRGGWVNNNCQ